MIQIAPHSKIYICATPIDFRNGIDGLIGLSKTLLFVDPFSGVTVLFKNRSSNSVKILSYDGQGFWLHQKRLSEGRFKWWPKDGTSKIDITSHELYIFLANGNPTKAEVQKNFR